MVDKLVFVVSLCFFLVLWLEVNLIGCVVKFGNYDFIILI